MLKNKSLYLANHKTNALSLLVKLQTDSGLSGRMWTSPLPFKPIWTLNVADLDSFKFFEQTCLGGHVSGMYVTNIFLVMLLGILSKKNFYAVFGYPLSLRYLIPSVIIQFRSNYRCSCKALRLLLHTITLLTCSEGGLLTVLIICNDYVSMAERNHWCESQASDVPHYHSMGGRNPTAL